MASAAVQRSSTGPAAPRLTRFVQQVRAGGSWPTGRAVLGGLLIAVSAVGLFAAHRAATAVPTRDFVVATRDIPIGHRITAEDLGLAPMRLVDVTASNAFADPGAVIGREATATIAANDLLQASAFAEAPVDPGASPRRRVTVSLPLAQALGGAIASGQRVDLLRTGDVAGSTVVLSRDVIVGGVDRDGVDRLGAEDRVALTLLVADDDAAIGVVDASLTGRITVVAAQGAPGGG